MRRLVCSETRRGSSCPATNAAARYGASQASLIDQGTIVHGERALEGVFQFLWSDDGKAKGPADANAQKKEKDARKHERPIVCKTKGPWGG